MTYIFTNELLLFFVSCLPQYSFTKISEILLQSYLISLSLLYTEFSYIPSHFVKYILNKKYCLNKDILVINKIYKSVV
jgi:hypothetical protein